MAKGGPEVGNTVPIKDANGNVTGWTTPEYAEALGIPTPSGGELSLGGDGSGYSNPNPIYNPYTGDYEPVGGTDGRELSTGYEGADNYKQHLDLGTGQNYWIPVVDGEPIMTLDEAKSGNYNWVPSASGVGVVLDTGQGVTQPPPTTQPPTTQPPSTTQPPDTAPPYTPPPAPPGVDEPTDDWFWTDPVGYENAPQPDGDGSFRPVTEDDPVPPDTSWDWSFFRDRAPGDRQWGGYDEDYQAFERYVPGMESPWGLPNVAGGNKDFYQQQFLNQLRDEQGYQNRERAAQLRRYEASLPENQPEPITADQMWSWAYGNKGLPDVNLGGNAPEASWELSNAFTPGETTNRDILQYFQQKDAFQSEGDQKRFKNWLANDPSMQPDSGANFWARAGSPQEIISRLPTDKSLDPANYDWISRMAKAMYNQGQIGPVAPTNYATPVAWGSSYNQPAGG